MMLIRSILSLPFIRLHLMFITLDGLSNSGKSTQAESLTRRIQNVNNIWSYTEYARCMDEITSTLDNRGFGQKTNEHFRIVRAARPFAALTAAYKTFRSIPAHVEYDNTALLEHDLL